MKQSGFRTDTCVSFDEFVDWIGINKFYANGLTTEANLDSLSGCNKCECGLFENGWQSKKYYSRMELKSLLKRAENLFVKNAQRFPCATQIYNEPHKYEFGNYGYLTKKLDLKGVPLNYKCDDVTLGVAVFESRGNIDISAQIGAITDETREITAIITVNDADLFNTLNNLQDRLVVLFTEEDLTRDCPTLDLNTIRDFAVRPVDSITVVDNNDGTQTISIVIKIHLLKRPSLDDSDGCCVHGSGDCYVEDLELFEMRIDKCQQGSFVCKERDCSNPPCENSRVSLCASDAKCGCGIEVSPEPITCTYNEADDTYTLDRNCPACTPFQVEINYISGDPLKCFRVQDDIKDAIFKLAVGIDPCHKEWCTCDICPDKKWDYYGGHNVVKVETGKQSGDYDTTYQLILTKYDIEIAQGYNPTRGLIEGLMDTVSYLRCCELEGTFN